MRRPCISLVAAAASLAAGLSLTATTTYAQRAAEAGGEQSQQQQTRQTPAMREKVYDRLAKAQECSENDDMQCTRRLLDEVRAMTDLNSYEMAQMWNFYAFIYYNQENYPEAITAYENVLKQPDLPVALQTQTMYALAQLYTQQEQYPQALEMLNRWFMVAENPQPEPYYLKATIHYQLQQYREGLEPIQAAIRLAQQQNKRPQEGWYQLLNVFYFELEDYPNVIRTLTTLIENWPKKDYLVQLAGIYGQQGEEDRQLALYEAAYDMGWLTRGTEIVTLSQMLLQAEIPYKAGRILEKGLEDGSIESTEANWRLLAQAWQLAQEDEKALPALTRSGNLARDGEMHLRLANSYANLARYEECVEAARDALRKGGLSRTDQANVVLGSCLVELKQYNDARTAFQTAARDERSRRTAQQYLQYIDNEVSREREIQAALRR